MTDLLKKIINSGVALPIGLEEEINNIIEREENQIAEYLSQEVTKKRLELQEEMKALVTNNEQTIDYDYIRVVVPIIDRKNLKLAVEIDPNFTKFYPELKRKIRVENRGEYKHDEVIQITVTPKKYKKKDEEQILILQNDKGEDVEFKMNNKIIVEEELEQETLKVKYLNTNTDFIPLFELIVE